MSAQDNPPPMFLFVDDEANTVKYFQQAIEKLAPVVTAGSVEEGRRALDEHAKSLLVLVSDQRMPGGYGNELLQYARLHYPHIVRILTTAFSELVHTIEAVNHGHIHGYISKPWELTALRVKMKQALDYASLRKDHAQLLQEKLRVLDKQTLLNRIGALNVLCAALTAPEDFPPLGAYLSAAAAVGIKPMKGDWMPLEYSEMVSIEALRSARFGSEVQLRLAEIRRRFQGRRREDAFLLLAELLGDKVQLCDDGTALFSDTSFFVEFLEARPNIAVSPQHISWPAFLIWLHEAGGSAQMTKSSAGMQCRLGLGAAPTSPMRLADWMERFSEMEDDADGW